MATQKKYFYEKISDETKKELDEFLIKHPKNQITYWEWREALAPSVKVLNEMAESTKQFGEQVESLLNKYQIPTMCSALTAKDWINLNNLNAELSNLAVVPNQEISSKLEILHKKHY